MKILVSNVAEFEKEINRLNKRAHKIGVALIKATRLGEKNVVQTVLTSFDGEVDERRVPMTVMQYEVEIPAMDDYRWTLAAKVTPIEGSDKAFVESHVKGLDVTPYENGDPCRCQHCNIRRERSWTYVVKNKDDGRLQQVGRTCFADYVGKNGLAALEFQALVTSILGNGDEDFCFPGGGGRGIPVLNVKQIITTAEACCAMQGGWRNNEYDEEGRVTTPGTHRHAAFILRGGNSPALKQVTDFLATSDGAVVSAKVDEAIEELKEIEFNGDEDDFGRQLQYCVNFEVVPAAKAGLVAYAAQYLRSRKARAEREARKATMKHVGTVGKREDFKNLKLVRLPSYQSDFGTTYIHVFNDVDGNELIWKTGQACADIGEVISLKGTVKEHGEYNGTPNTVLSRCKVL